jgi:hypothetical protein
MTPMRQPWNALPAEAHDDDAGLRTVPYDYSFQFGLEGKPGNALRQKVTVSVEGSFSAVSIGYGVVPEVTPVIFGPRAPAPLVVALANMLVRRAPPVTLAVASAALSALGASVARPPPTSLRDISLGDLLDAIEAAIPSAPDAPKGMPPLEAALRNGIKLNPDFVRVALGGNGTAVLDEASLTRLFQVVSAPVEDVRFLYALADEGSGREFQSEPVLNIAGLGASDGKRPFRYFAQPVTFAPLATIRMDITELSDFRGELHVALHGYKALGGEGSPTDARGDRARRGRR